MRLSPLACVATSALFCLSAADVSPMGKVIKLVADMKKSVQSDAKKEAAVYAKFACFCKENTKVKSKAIVKEEDKVDTLSGDIGDTAAQKKSKELEVQKRQKNQEQMSTDLTATVSRCAKAHAEYESDHADTSKAVSSLKKAVRTMQSKKGKMGAASLISYTLKVADSMNLVAPEHKAAAAFLQGAANVDPSDPAFKYHSKAINQILAKLLKDFTKEKTARVGAWKKTSAACKDEKAALSQKMKDNMDATTKAKGKIQGLKKVLAKTKGNLVETKDDLKGDQKYMKDVTSQCETKAVEFDQRAKSNNEVITALTQVMSFLTNKKSSSAADVVYKKKGSLLQVSQRAVAWQAESSVKAHSFLAPTKVVTNFLSRSSASVSEQATMDQVTSLLRVESERLGSPELSAMAMTVAGDHFKKVKGVLQTLIARLLDESKAEASKNGFCKTQLAMAQLNRDQATQKAKAMSAELGQYESSKEELEAELVELTKGIAKTQKALAESTALRNKEKKQNQESVATVKEGLEALGQAKIFFLKATDAQIALIQASPTKAISGLLDIVSSEFERIVVQTENAEAAAHADFVKFDRTAKADLASKDTKTKLDNLDLKNTKNSIQKTLTDLKTQMSLVDNNLKMIKSLRPVCLDGGGMNYKERVAKRNEEVAALKKALTILK